MGEGTPWADTPPRVDTEPLRVDTLQGDTPLPHQTTTAADGTHPTGMLSCSLICLGPVTSSVRVNAETILFSVKTM